MCRMYVYKNGRAEVVFRDYKWRASHPPTHSRSPISSLSNESAISLADLVNCCPHVLGCVRGLLVGEDETC